MYVKTNTMDQWTFSQAKAHAAKALREGRIQHEAREAQTQKNLLATGGIDTEEALQLIQATRGQQAKCSPHHADASIQVWVFRPQDWYIKFYLLDQCIFISFHRNR